MQNYPKWAISSPRPIFQQGPLRILRYIDCILKFKMSGLRHEENMRVPKWNHEITCRNGCTAMRPT